MEIYFLQNGFKSGIISKTATKIIAPANSVNEIAAGADGDTGRKGKRRN